MTMHAQYRLHNARDLCRGRDSRQKSTTDRWPVASASLNITRWPLRVFTRRSFSILKRSGWTLYVTKVTSRATSALHAVDIKLCRNSYNGFVSRFRCHASQRSRKVSPWLQCWPRKLLLQFDTGLVSRKWRRSNFVELEIDTPREFISRSHWNA